MDAYSVLLTRDKPFKALIIMCNSETPLQNLSRIESELMNLNLNGCILMDQILHVGNNDERFISFYIDGQGIRRDSIRFERIPKHSGFRKLSCKFLKDKQLFEASILSSIQKNMIRNGIAI